MPATTSLGIPYPLSTDPPAGHTQMQSLASKVDDLLQQGFPGTPWAMAAGQVPFTFTAETTKSVAVTFPSSRFAVTPIAAVGIPSAPPVALYEPRLSPITATGMTINLAFAAAQTYTGAVSYIAVQMLSTDARG